MVAKTGRSAAIHTFSKNSVQVESAIKMGIRHKIKTMQISDEDLMKKNQKSNEDKELMNV